MAAKLLQFPHKTTISALSRRTPGESNAERLNRLARKADLQGVRIRRLYRTERLLVASSASDPDTCYVLDIITGQCSCDGNFFTGVCKHVAAALAELGELPD